MSSEKCWLYCFVTQNRIQLINAWVRLTAFSRKRKKNETCGELCHNNVSSRSPLPSPSPAVIRTTYKLRPQACTTPPQPLLSHASNKLSWLLQRETNSNVTIPGYQLSYAPRIPFERSTSKKNSRSICQHQQFATQLLSVRWAGIVVVLYLFSSIADAFSSTCQN